MVIHRADVAGRASRQRAALFGPGVLGNGTPELLACEFQILRAHAVGQKAEVPNADEVLRQDVKQITAQELVGVEIHRFFAITIAECQTMWRKPQ
jgi:hypothetical protein